MVVPVIKTENINRRFKAGREVIYALKNVSISIKPNTLTILRGRSGSGKTTLINLLGALDYPDEGHIYFNGNDITKFGESKRGGIRRKNMGFVFQSVALVSLMTAYENVEFALRVSGYSRREMKRRAEECLALVGLQKRMTHRPGELSGGEQQRVAIARAIAHNPSILFADEPTGELDTHTSLQVMKVFRELVEKEALTIVMTTHDPNMVEIADQVITLEDGEVVEEHVGNGRLKLGIEE